jgi:hypothetical protein
VIVVAASLFPSRASREGWGASTVPTPCDEDGRWVNLLDGETLDRRASDFAAAELFRVLPVAVLAPERIAARLG